MRSRTSPRAARPVHLAFATFAALAAGIAGSALGCASSAPSSTDTGGLDAKGAASIPGHDTNPDGVPYPTANVGYRARGVDGLGRPRAEPGNVIANYKFYGYPDADTSKGLQTVALADFFDPKGAKYKIIHIAVAGVWCPPCNQETDVLVKLAPTLRDQGVVFLQALGDGPQQSIGATKQDLDFWVSTHGANFTEVLDPGLKNLGVFFEANVLPWNADIDARTMELLASGVGYEDPANDVKTWLDWYEGKKE